MVPLSPASGIAGAGTHKVVVDRADGATQTLLAQSGARLLVNYDSFVLWEVPDTKIQTFVGRASVQQRDDFDDIYVRTGKITAPSNVPPVPANLRQSKASGFQLWLVQFVGPIKGDWLDNLHKLGIAVVIYMPNNAYVVWVNGAGLKQLEGLVGKDPTVQWTGAYEPAYRLEPSLQTLTGAQPVAVTIQFYRTANTPAALASVRSLGGAVLKPAEEILNFTDITLAVPASALVTIANRADVFNVEPFVPPQRRDEAQGQIVAGSVVNSGGNVVPSGPGYLAWLASKGFPTDPAQYPIVDVVDDGIDNGTTAALHPDFHQLGQAGDPSRIVFNGNCTADAAADGREGHGNLNAGIVGSYNNLTGAPHVDANGYRVGLGVSPYTRIAGTKIFRNGTGSFDISACGGTDRGVVANAYNNGATFTSNSWGSDTGGAYTSEDQAYDSLTRNASAATPGNHQMLHVFAAGNAGSGGAGTVGSPGSAKNVLTVGATENVRENGVTDGCGYSGAASADNIAAFSSRGPAADGRVKPDIMAPGTHVQGPASQDPGYTGTGICDQYHPAGQTLYAWSTGTSHSTPATAGAASLLYNYYGRVLDPGQTPSPAMLKALLLNTPRYLNGAGTGGTLPSNNQGWGDVNLGALFDGTTRYLMDQSNILTTTGQIFTRNGTVADASKPVRVTLVWTDAPGSTTGNAYVNDLNLEVTVGGNTYKGNVFSGANSVTGGVADAKNNVENVFLPAGASGAITVKVTAANLAGKADPSGPGTVNQDFALVVSDGTISAGGAPNLAVQPATFSDAAPGGNNNGAIDPGETVTLTVPLINGGDAAATGVSGTLTTATGTVTILNGTSAYSNIAPGATINNGTAFRIRVSTAQVCGTPLNFSFTATYNGGLTATTAFSLPTGTPTLGASQSYASTDVPKAIPDNTPAGVTSNLPIATTGAVGKVVVHLDVTHTYDSDLVFTLIAPDSTPVTLIDRRGGSGRNFTGTVLDDGATTAISAGVAPFTGSFRPEQPLAALSGKAINGTWQLKAADLAAQDTGTINSWSLDIRPSMAVCAPLGATTISALSASSGGTTGGNTETILGTNFGATPTVAVDGAPVTPTSVSDTQIAITMPPHAAGVVTITVTGTYGAPTAQYTYGVVNTVPAPRPGAPPVGSPGAVPAPGPRPTVPIGGPTPNPLPAPRP